MNTSIHTTPWQHATVTDFFTQEILDELDKFSISRLEKHGYSVSNPKYGLIEPSHQRRYGDQLGNLGLEVSKVLIDFYKEYYEKLDTGNNQLYKINPEHIILEFQARPANEPYPDDGPNIHTDTDFKIMSFVIGLSDKGAGTKLYFQDRTVSHETQYVKNGGLVFVRNREPGKETLHSIHNNVDALRRVLVAFIVDPYGEKFMKKLKK